jgi:hypothetical protein
MGARTRVPPDPTGWVSAAEAADGLGLAEAYVAAGSHTGRFPVVRHNGVAWMRAEDLERLAEHRSEDHRRWASYAEIEQLAGCSNGTLDRAIRAGEVEVRAARTDRAQRSLERASAERWAVEWRSERDAARKRRDARARRESEEPPDDGHVWLDTTTAALVVGVTENWLRHLASTSKAPATRRGRRWWWRRDLVESFAAARVVQESAVPRE